MKKLYYKILDIFFPCKHVFGQTFYNYFSKKDHLIVREFQICEKCGEIHSVYYKQEKSIS